MPLKHVIPSLDAVPENLRSLYVQKDGKFVLDVDGAIAVDEHERIKVQLAEFRDNNRALNTSKTELEAKLAALKDVDPEKYRTALTELDELKKKAPAKDSELAAIRTQLDALGKSLTESAERERKSAVALAEKDLEVSLTQAGIKAGVDEKALLDYLGRAKRVFRIEDGKIKTDVFSKKNVTTPMTVDEFVADLPAEAPHLFKPSKGGGANPPGPGGSGGNGATRTITAGSKLTEQDLKDLAAGTAVREVA